MSKHLSRLLLALFLLAPAVIAQTLPTNKLVGTLPPPKLSFWQRQMYSAQLTRNANGDGYVMELDPTSPTDISNWAMKRSRDNFQRIADSVCAPGKAQLLSPVTWDVFIADRGDDGLDHITGEFRCGER